MRRINPTSAPLALIMSPLPVLLDPAARRLFGILMGAFFAIAPSLAEDKRISVEGPLEVMIPADLRGLPIINPHVDLIIDVGEDGTLFDVMPTKSNHRGLLPDAIKAIQSASFTPAIRDGKSVRSRDSVRVTFYDPEQRAWRQGSGVLPFGGTPSDAAKNRIYATSANSFVYDISDPEELDRPIAQLQTTRRIHSSQDGVKTVGECLVEFYIDPAGRARFPRAIESDSNDVAISAALTLLETRFTPPRRNGQPTYVKIQQRFRFD
jgi:hypothetical protein